MELFQSIAEAISLYRYIFWPLLALMALVLIFIRWWDQVRYFFLNVMCRMPVIGHVARLSRANEPRRQGTGGEKWYPVEEELCAKYWQYYNISNLDANFYLRCVNYLNKVDERGRKPTGVVLWCCSIALVLLEAFIFALVLSPFIANNISANQAEFSAVVVSILIGVILVPATHLMGAELHKNTLLKKIRYWYDDARRGGSAKGLSKINGVSLENTYVDDHEPNYLQMLSRVTHNVGAKPQYWATAVALALIIFFAVGAYFVRAATINTLETQVVNGSPFSQVVASGEASPFDLPAGAVQDNAKADTQASKEITDNRVFASKLTFIILSVIFVGVQLIGILIGIFRSFAGIESKAAAKYIGDFSGSEAFEQWHAMRCERVVRDAQEKLTALQNRIMMKDSNSQSGPLVRLPTFADYIRGKQNDKNQAQAQAAASRVAHDAARASETVERAAPVQPVVAAEAVAPAPVVETKTAPDRAPAADEEKQRIQALGDLTQLSEEELALIAEDMDLPLESLLKRQRVQAVLNKARHKESA